MEITFLGTGTSQGVPVIGCNCEVCNSMSILDQRLRTSVLIKSSTTTICIDAGPDFRQQMLRENVKKLDAVLITHGHKDHVGGLDDIRSFNFLQGKPMPVYANNQAIESIKKEFFYAFEDDKYPGVPDFDMNIIDIQEFTIGDIKISPFEVMHRNLPVTGFRIGDLTYITDANFISKESMDLIHGSKTLIINALRKEKHISHFNLAEALEVIEEVKPEIAFITHISHLMGKHQDVSWELPDNVHFAVDGMKIKFA